MTVAPLRAFVGGSRWLRYPLIVPGAAAVTAAALMFGRFLRTWPVETRRATYRAAALFLFGALVLETAGGWFDPIVYGQSFTYIALATLEEGCELFGATLFLVALLRYVERTVGPLEVNSGDQ
jgi:hypothetical protein